MGVFATKLGPLFLWQAFVLVAAFAGTAVVSYVGLDLTDDASSAIAEDEQLIPATIGDLIITVSTDGNLSFPEVETALFETRGTVGEIMVTEGDSVQVGDSLAQLDEASIADLDLDVARAEVSLRDAETKLEDALAPAESLAIARAKANIAKAEQALEKARENHDSLVAGATTEEVADARFAIAEAETDVARAEQALEKAHENHDSLVAGATTEEVADARLAIADAETDVANANTSLGLTAADWDGRVADAQTLLDDSITAYSDLFDRWLGVAPANVDTTQAPGEILTSLGVDLDTIFPDSASEVNFALLGSLQTDDPTTLWNEATVYTFLTFYPGLIVGVCSTAPLQGSCVSDEFDTAWAAVGRESIARDTKVFDANKAIADAETDVAKAEQALEKARENHDSLVAGATTEEVADARLAIAEAETNVTKANKSLVEANEDLIELLAPATVVDLDVTATSLAVTETELAAENQDLVDLLAVPDERDIEVLRAQLVNAKIALDSSRSILDGSTLTAPIAGVVTEIDFETGDNALGNNTGGITIVDESVVELAGTVDEIDVLFIAEGALASVSLSALPGQQLLGTITEIDTPTNNQGVVEFPVSITIDVPAGLDLREGLTATASVLISQQLNVLRVPTSAIQGSFLEPFVRVSTNSGIVDRPVALGSSDDFWVVVAEGLTEGEEVVMPAPSAASTLFGNIQFGQLNQAQLLRQLQGRGGGQGRGQGGQGGGGQGGGGRNN
jgi:macrolide-specific efflux system membrane fusion protein